MVMASIGKSKANTADDIPVHVFIQVERIRARIGAAYQQHYIAYHKLDGAYHQQNFARHKHNPVRINPIHEHQN